jgi:uncharacterized protein (DUF952 family)
MFVHFARQEEWETAQEEGKYEPPEYKEKGFISCWMPDQAADAANEQYAGEDGLALIWIMPMKVTSPILYKRPDGQELGDLFPFINGPLNLEAVLRVDRLDAWEPGAFVLPASPPPVTT